VTTALEVIENDVRDLVRVRGLDPAIDDRSLFIGLVDEAIVAYESRIESGGLPPVTDVNAIKETVFKRIAGLGPIQELLDDPEVEEIWMNGPGRLFCASRGRHSLTNIVVDESAMRGLVERMLRASGRRLDLSSPFVDATLLDGSRLHVAIPDVTRKHWAVNIRKFVLQAHRLEELVRLGSIDNNTATFLAGAVASGLNVIVSGGTQTGKTTMLNCLASTIPASQRIVTCEEVFELQIPLPDVVGMQTRQPNLEGRGAIDLRRLITEALRMRPDRIIVGEVRQSEAFDMLVALNSGLPGMASIHANSADEALTKLTTLPLLAGENVTHQFVVPAVAAAIDLVVHLSHEDSRRVISEVMAVTGRIEGNAIETSRVLVRRGARMRWAGGRPPHEQRWAGAGYDLVDILKSFPGVETR
jgi:pilus assembly protein CpaF